MALRRPHPKNRPHGTLGLAIGLFKYTSGKRCSSARSQPSLLRSQYTLCPISRIFSYLPTAQRLGFKHTRRGTVACATIRLIVSDGIVRSSRLAFRYFYQGLPHSPHSGFIVTGSSSNRESVLTGSFFYREIHNIQYSGRRQKTRSEGSEASEGGPPHSS